MKNWTYYNHAMIPTTPPHEKVNTECIADKSIWKKNKNALLARWTSDFDCGDETNWWYVIKDEPFDITALKAKRRYEINKGRKNFIVREVDAKEYVDDIYKIQVEAFKRYPVKYRPNVEKEKLREQIMTWNWYKVYGAFDIETDVLSGYALLSRTENYISFVVLKVLPEKEVLAINAAIVSHILEMHKEFLVLGGYICDGARNIQHETHFQEYLEKYFGFRKAYCKLHICYNPKIYWIVKILYRFREILQKFDDNKLIHQINGVLLMESFKRECER